MTYNEAKFIRKREKNEKKKKTLIPLGHSTDIPKYVRVVFKVARARFEGGGCEQTICPNRSPGFYFVRARLLLYNIC